MKVVLDTNVLGSAFISRGHSHELLEHLARHHDLFTSEYILAECQATLVEKFRMPQDLVAAAVELQRLRMVVVDPAPINGVVEEDPDDDAVVATAVAAGADCLITGDGALLKLKQYKDIPIIQASAFWVLEQDA